MHVSGTGAGVGALIGALGRALVVIFWLGPQACIIALPSAGIGLLVGAIAGSLGRPLRGALLGFVLSAFVFELFMCACASVLGDLGSIFGGKDAEMAFLTAVLPYTLLMGVAGAAAGGIGGYVGSVSRRNEQNGGGTPTRAEQPAERGSATDQPPDERFFER
jgi:hypothetical protein